MQIAPNELTRLLQQAYLEGYQSGFRSCSLITCHYVPLEKGVYPTTFQLLKDAHGSWADSITKNRSIPATFNIEAAL